MVTPFDIENFFAIPREDKPPEGISQEMHQEITSRIKQQAELATGATIDRMMAEAVDGLKRTTGLLIDAMHALPAEDRNALGKLMVLLKPEALKDNDGLAAASNALVRFLERHENTCSTARASSRITLLLLYGGFCATAWVELRGVSDKRKQQKEQDDGQPGTG